MNQTNQALLLAVQKAIWNTDITFAADTDWDAVLREAEQQTVLGIVIDVAPAEAQHKWKSRVGTNTANFIRILHYQSGLCDLFEKNGIPLVILKGMAAAVYYPNPSKRAMGDIDFLVPEEKIDAAKDLLLQNGYVIKEEKPGYLRHITAYKDGIEFEMHRYFSYDNTDTEAYIRQDLNNPEIGSVYGMQFPMLSKLANGLVLLTHLMHHLKSGLGLRQVIDWMLYVDKVLDDTFWNETFQKVVQTIGLEVAAKTVTRLCQLYLGLSERITWCKEANPETCSELLEHLFFSGNFGVKNGRGSKIEFVTVQVNRRGLFRYLQTAGQYNWNAYRKHKWLKPFCWIYQIGRYIKQGVTAKRNGKQVLDDLNRGSQLAEMLRKLGI